MTASRPSGALPAILTFLLIAFLTFLAIDQVQPPARVSASAPVTEFSSGRAMVHLRAIAQNPHPTGSPENAKVREYLVKEIKAMGVDPEVQTTTIAGSLPRRHGPWAVATVHNVVAKLRGTSNLRALLLTAHYDSVPSGPGASDDGAGVAALLETLGALKAGRPLRNDVIFLFTDAEELGLLGAKAFVEDHPWKRDAAVALNFDARGSCGPSVMFETSPKNGWLIREFAKAAPHPVTSSLLYEAYKRLPNDTDLTIFKRAGLAGLNFAYGGCWPRYHTLRDDVRALDERSLQHHGSYALALARHFGNLNLDHTAGEDAVYFSLFRRTLYYSEAAVIPLMVVVLLAFVGVMALGLRSARLTWRGITGGCLGWLAGAVAAALVSELTWLALRKTRLVSLLPYGMAYNSELYAVGFIALTIAIISAVYATLGKRTSVEDLTVGGLLWWLLLMMLASLYVRAASFAFTWPLLSSLIELGYALIRKGRESEAARALIWTLPAIVGILLFGPIPYLLLILLSTSGLLPLSLAVALLLGFLAPHLDIITAQRRWLLPGAAALVGVGLIIAGMFFHRFDAEHPRADSVFYALNADTRKAVWASSDKAPDEWTSQFFPAPPQAGSLAEWGPFEGVFMKSAAPGTSLAAPTIAPIDDLTVGDNRILHLRVMSPRQARRVWISVQNAVVLEANVNGRKIGGTDPAAQGGGSWGFFYTGLPKEGLTLTVEVKGTPPLTIKVVDQSDGLPEIQGMSFKPRPDTVMPAPWPPFDSSTLVGKSYRFEAPP